MSITEHIYGKLSPGKRVNNSTVEEEHKMLLKTLLRFILPHSGILLDFPMFFFSRKPPTPRRFQATTFHYASFLWEFFFIVFKIWGNKMYGQGSTFFF